MSIQKMRDRSEGIVAKVIVGLIIIVFAAFGMGSITTFLAPVAKVATVNGDDITQQEMEIEVERTRRILLSQNPSQVNIDEDQIRKDVLQNLVNRKLLTQVTEDFGMQYGDEKLDAEIIDTPAFQIDGVFNPQQFQLVLGSAGYNPLSYRKEMRRDKVFVQLNRAIRSTSFLTEDEIERANSLAQQKRDIAFLRVDVAELSKTITVSEMEISEYYASHNADFLTAETVDLEYIEIKRDDLLSDVEVDDDQLTLYFDETKDIYAEPERRRIAHILIEVNDDVTETAAKTKIDELYSKLTAGGDFAVIAKASSDDTGSAESGGDLGFNDQGTFVEEFETAANKLTLNQLSKPVKTEFGYHILKLLDIEEAKQPVFADVKDRVEAAFRKVGAEALFVTQSSDLSEISYESTDLVEPAEVLGLEIKSTGHIASDSNEGIAANAAVMDAAFSADVLEDGNNSQLIEITPNHHIVVRVKAHQVEEVKALTVVTEDIKNLLALDAAKALASQQVEEMTTMLESGSITRFVADKFGLTWTVEAAASRNQANMDREINREAFKLPRPATGDKSVGYAILSNGDGAVISVTNVQNKQDDAGADLESLGNVLASQQGISDYREFSANLAKTGSIK